jgi:prephenate dehydrogenase
LHFQRIAIFGPGLIGGSLALAARQHGLCARLSLWSRDPRERAAARDAGLADSDDTVTGDPALAVAGAELVFLCVPPAALIDVARRIAPHLEPGAAVSDVASVKEGLTAELGEIFSADTGSRYVGAHPMAGSERSGPTAARADLFEGAACLLTPDATTAPDALATVETFWREVGARVRQITPAEHDASVALVSHLPHVLAAALVHFVAAQPGEAARCAGPGWRDVTRIAAGSPELWTEILSRNRPPVTKALHGMVAKLREVLGYLEAGREPELQNFLSEARSQRETPADG